MSRAAGLEFDGLAGGYGSTEVVHDVSGRVAPGGVLCVVGRNGVGKSTLVKLLLGYLPALRGSVRLNGRALDALDVVARHRAGISYCPQERPVFDDLDVRDNLTLMRADRSLDAFAPCFERFPILGKRLGQHAGTLSGGEKKLLSFTRAWAEAQPVMVLDEPTEGVQWENILQMQALIEGRRADGCGLLIVEQNLAFAERVASDYLLIDQGRVVLADTAANVDRATLERHLAV
ncbi:MAG: ABC transporter ATP-binding protein [Lautropia sp.]